MKQEFHNISLHDRNSFHIDESAKHLIEFETIDELVTIFRDTPPQNWYVISGGNNILFTKEFCGTLLTPTSQEITILNEDSLQATIRVGAGLEWDDLVEWATQNNLWGIENLSLIPGKCGAAPVQNIGAYGAEAKDVIEIVEMFCPDTLNTLKLPASHCNFAYRDSIFKSTLKGRVIITHIVIKLSKIAAPNLGYGDVIEEVSARGGVTLRNIRDAICAIRSRKLPDTKVLGNAGSFFKNPMVELSLAEELKAEHPTMPIYPIKDDPSKVKLAAGWLIDQVGMKGFKEGSVGVHENQALVLVNLGGARGEDILTLAAKIQAMVKSQFGVEIEPEVNIL